MREMGTPGGFAREQFESGRRAWRKKIAGVARIIFWPPIAIAGLVALWADGIWLFLMGVIAGGSMAAYVVLLDDVPPHVRRWEEGAEGEEKTAAELSKLAAEGWTAIHDVDPGVGNWDHVLVGPAGVFLLETKYLRGVVQVRNEVFGVTYDEHANRFESFEKVSRGVVQAAVRLKQTIEDREGVKVWVQPVVVVWGRFPQRVVEADRITYLAGEDLIAWVRQRQGVLSVGRQALVSATVAELIRLERHPASKDRIRVPALP